MKRSVFSIAAGLGVLCAAGTPQIQAQQTDNLAGLVEILRETDDAQLQLDVLRGVSEALAGKRDLEMPKGWQEVEEKLGESRNNEVRLLTQSLGLAFGSQRALEELRAVVRDRSANAGARRAALNSLLANRDPELPELLLALLEDPALRSAALKVLAQFEQPAAPEKILELYPSLNATEKRDALNTLASRVLYAKPLLASVAEGEVPRQDLTADLVRQLRNLKSTDLDETIQKVWGAYRDSSADKQQEIERYKRIYRAGGSQPGDAIRGRAVFARVCQQCHTLFGIGGAVGPDITGSNRGDLDYILQNIVDPNAVIPNDYRSSTIDTKDDRVITGIVKQEDANAITVATANETLLIPKQDVAAVALSSISMMPEGLLEPLTEQEVRDLIYYLSRPGQVPLLATPDTVAYFFNGKDLAGWDGNTDLWRVENGEIVGSTEQGLKHNEFLKSQMVFSDFRLTCQVKLTPNTENSGIQFRSEPLPNGEVKGYQADMGAGWWGKLYEEEGRGLLWDKPGEAAVKPGEWNTYEIVAQGHHIRTFLNGKPCVDLQDPKGALQGVIALQLHSGGPMEVRFKDFEIEVLPAKEAKQAAK